MNYITEVEGLAGKTIESAKFFDYKEFLILRFKDDEAAILRSDEDETFLELISGEHLGIDQKLEADIITKYEYNTIKAREIERHQLQRKAKEIQQLAALKAKYPDM